MFGYSGGIERFTVKSEPQTPYYSPGNTCTVISRTKQTHTFKPFDPTSHLDLNRQDDAVIKLSGYALFEDIIKLLHNLNKVENPQLRSVQICMYNNLN